jgi:hypothetical protein
LKYSEWIWRFAAHEGKKVKYIFANTTAEGKKVKSFTTEHFRVSNLINHITLRIKIKKKYSEWIWRFYAREGKKVKSSCKYPVKMNEINPKYENTRKIHRLLTNQNPGFLYKMYTVVKELRSKISVSFRYKSLRHDWHTGDDKK